MTVGFEVDDDIAVATLNRPDAMNAISGALADDLREVMREVGSRPDIKVLVLTGAGDKAFCAGADLKERGTFELEDFIGNRRQMTSMFQAVREVPQPSVAAVFGFTLGGGFELALSCDLIVAADTTQLGLPEARVGLVPGGGGTQLLPRKVGSSKAKELIFTGRRMGAQEALALGLVTRVVGRTELRTAALELARDIGKSSPVAVREAKRIVDATFGLALEDAIALESKAWSRVIATADRAEGIAAFNEKREPRWANR
jgi:enoyl-CoA hydratase/carnithine racemase